MHEITVNTNTKKMMNSGVMNNMLNRCFLTNIINFHIQKPNTYKKPDIVSMIIYHNFGNYISLISKIVA